MAGDSAESVEWLVRKCHALVVQALVEYSKGPPQVTKSPSKEEEGKKKKKKTRVYPYGARAALVNEDFKNLPSPWLATTVATFYPFVADPKETWDHKLKHFSHPMTRLWPVGVVRRHMHFIQVFRDRREELFESYEKEGGKYHGRDDSSEESSSTEAETMQVYSDCDDVFSS
jgi:hypothetical protein